MADYNCVYKDMCAKEFLRLKDCYLVRFFSLSFFFFLLERGRGCFGGDLCTYREGGEKGFS